MWNNKFENGVFFHLTFTFFYKHIGNILLRCIKTDFAVKGVNLGATNFMFTEINFTGSSNRYITSLVYIEANLIAYDLIGNSYLLI